MDVFQVGRSHKPLRCEEAWADEAKLRGGTAFHQVLDSSAWGGPFPDVPREILDVKTSRRNLNMFINQVGLPCIEELSPTTLHCCNLATWFRVCFRNA